MTSIIASITLVFIILTWVKPLREKLWLYKLLIWLHGTCAVTYFIQAGIDSDFRDIAFGFIWVFSGFMWYINYKMKKSTIILREINEEIDNIRQEMLDEMRRRQQEQEDLQNEREAERMIPEKKVKKFRWF